MKRRTVLGDLLRGAFFGAAESIGVSEQEIKNAANVAKKLRQAAKGEPAPAVKKARVVVVEEEEP